MCTKTITITKINFKHFAVVEWGKVQTYCLYPGGGDPLTSCPRNNGHQGRKWGEISLIGKNQTKALPSLFYHKKRKQVLTVAVYECTVHTLCTMFLYGDHKCYCLYSYQSLKICIWLKPQTFDNPSTHLITVLCANAAAMFMVGPSRGL